MPKTVDPPTPGGHHTSRGRIWLYIATVKLMMLCAGGVVAIAIDQAGDGPAVSGCVTVPLAN